jgi:hypothetical protein
VIPHSLVITPSELPSPPTVPPAYLDPISGSLVLQLPVASVLGRLVAPRMSWGKIKARLSRRQPETDKKLAPLEAKPGG